MEVGEAQRHEHRPGHAELSGQVAQTLGKATGQLDELDGKLERGKTRRGRPAVEAEISEVESGFRQMKDPHVVPFSPMDHWTDHKIRVH